MPIDAKDIVLTDARYFGTVMARSIDSRYCVSIMPGT